MNKTPLTKMQCSDKVAVRERFEDILDRHFASDNPHQTYAIVEALFKEVIEPLLAERP